MPGWLLAATITGTVFADRNANGARDPGEPGVAGVVVSNQVDVARTDAAGRYSLPGAGRGVVFVSVPDGWRARARFWRPAPSAGDAALDFPLDATKQPAREQTLEFPTTVSNHCNEDPLAEHAIDHPVGFEHDLSILADAQCQQFPGVCAAIREQGELLADIEQLL